MGGKSKFLPKIVPSSVAVARHVQEGEEVVNLTFRFPVVRYSVKP